MPLSKKSETFYVLSKRITSQENSLFGIVKYKGEPSFYSSFFKDKDANLSISKIEGIRAFNAVWPADILYPAINSRQNDIKGALPAENYVIIVTQDGLTNGAVFEKLSDNEKTEVVRFWQELHPDKPLPAGLESQDLASSDNDGMRA